MERGRPELFIGLVGPIGVDLETVEAAIVRELKHLDYESVSIRITELMKSVDIGIELKSGSYSEKYHSLIEYADKVCEKSESPAALAALAVAKIRSERSKITKDENRPALDHAYVIRQFKRPEEIDLMRKTYGRKFIQISVTSSDEDRQRRLFDNIKNFDEQTRDDAECKKAVIDLIRKDFDEGDEAF